MLAKHFVKSTFFTALLWIFAWLHLCQTTAAWAQISFSDPGFFAETVTALAPFTPVGVTFAPDGRLFIWKKPGTVRIFKNGQLLTAPFIDISAKVNQYGDRGLLGLALDPNFATNRYVYLLYVLETGGNSNDPSDKTSQLTRVTADPNNPDVALANSEIVILGSIPDNTTSHAIGTVRFASDGKLFLSAGEGADFSTVNTNALRAQDLNSLNGKILRINPNGSAPSDNPFYEPANPTSNRSKVWAYGLRNPFRFALRPATGSPLDNWPYIGDAGSFRWEEQNRGRGVNFGWPCYEGNFPNPDYQNAFAQCRQLSVNSVTLPLHTYDRTVGTTTIGGTFYTGTLYPAAYQGNYFFADYTSKWIKRMVFDANDNVVNVLPFAANVRGPVDLEMGPDGTIYYVAFSSGEIGRIRWGTGNQPPEAKAAAIPTSGYSALTVNFSSAGSADPEGGALTYFWDFGDGATSTLPNPSHTYVQGGVRMFTATLTVTDPGTLTASASVNVTVGSKQPVATIITPITGTKVDIGQTIVFQGAATDPDQGTLPESALSWSVLLHHNSHIHPLLATTGSTGSFDVVDHGAGNYSFEIILTATDNSGLTDTKSVTLPVNALSLPLAHLDFTYTNRSELQLAGWDFLAKTATGVTRDTEQTGNLAVNYDQVTHPSTIRIPLGSGEIWQTLNNSQNTLFRDLPSDWMSLRLKLAAFNPVANYQQVGLLAYQDDDNYINLNRSYVNGAQIELFREVAQATTFANRVALTNTGNLVFRIDRNAATNTYTGYYSTNGELNWVLVGSIVATLSNLRLGIQVGANQAGMLPVADLEWVEILRPGPAPAVSNITPTRGAQGQTLTAVVITGSNFVSGATCSFGVGITVTSCTFNSATQLTANVTIAANATIGTRPVKVTNPDTQSGSLANAFSVTAPGGVPTQHFPLTSSDSTALKAEGWDFLAKTTTGVTRNTEQTGALAVDYNQTTHPGVIRVPLGNGELWQALNNSQNTFFRNLPSDWVSIRLNIASFNPVANYQQVGLLAYQDDDTYVSVRRNFNSGAGGADIGGMYEVKGVGTVVERRTLTNSGNLILRLDRNLTTNTYSPLYSTNGGTTWVPLVGIPTVGLNNPRVGIQVGANVAGTVSVADLAWVEIVRAAPGPVVSGVTPLSGLQGQTLTNVVMSESNFVSGAVCNFGSGITVNSCTFNSSTQLTANVTIAAIATTGGRTVTVTNPDAQSGSLPNAFTMNAASRGPASTWISPIAAAQH